MMNNPFDRVIKDMQKRRKRAVEEVVLMVEADSKMLCPVDTGTLRRSITHDVKSDDKKTQGSVGSSVEYAYWAERKKPYLEPAVDQNKENIIRKIKEVMTPE